MLIMGVARIFQRGGHTDSYRGYSSDCHLNIVSCLLTRRLAKGGSRAPQDPPGYAYANWFNVAGFGLWLQKPFIKILTRAQALAAFVSFENVA